MITIYGSTEKSRGGDPLMPPCGNSCFLFLMSLLFSIFCHFCYYFYYCHHYYWFLAIILDIIIITALIIVIFIVIIHEHRLLTIPLLPRYRYPFQLFPLPSSFSCTLHHFVVNENFWCLDLVFQREYFQYIGQCQVFPKLGLCCHHRQLLCVCVFVRVCSFSPFLSLLHKI